MAKTDSIDSEINKEQIEKPKSGNKDFLIIGISFAVIIIIIGAFLFLPGFIDKKKVINNNEELKTLEQLHNENLNNGGLGEGRGIIYNNISFVFCTENVCDPVYEGLWNFQILSPLQTKVFRVYLHYTPTEVESIPVKGDFSDWLKLANNFKTLSSQEKKLNKNIFKKHSYLTIDSKSKNVSAVVVSFGELALNFGSAFNLGLLEACTKDLGKCDTNTYAIVSCDNESLPVIYLKEGNETSITFNNNCVVVEGNDDKLLMASERLLYHLYGIIQN